MSINSQPNFNMKISGFTLLEVLITLLVMAIGLLGLAALQISSLQNNQSAEFRGQATELVRSMSDRMRANREYVIANNGGVYDTLAPAAAPSEASCSVSPGCTSDLLAKNDLFEWNQNIVNVLPGGVGDIVHVSGSASTAVYSVSVNWLDVSGSDRSLNSGFAMEFQP